MMRPKNGPITCEIVKIVHDNSHKQVENEEATHDEETDEVEVSKVVPAPMTIGIWKEKSIV